MKSVFITFLVCVLAVAHAEMWGRTSPQQRQTSRRSSGQRQQRRFRSQTQEKTIVEERHTMRTEQRQLQDCAHVVQREKVQIRQAMEKLQNMERQKESWEKRVQELRREDHQRMEQMSVSYRTKLGREQTELRRVMGEWHQCRRVVKASEERLRTELTKRETYYKRVETSIRRGLAQAEAQKKTLERQVVKERRQAKYSLREARHKWSTETTELRKEVRRVTSVVRACESHDQDAERKHALVVRQVAHEADAKLREVAQKWAAERSARIEAQTEWGRERNSCNLQLEGHLRLRQQLLQRIEQLETIVKRGLARHSYRYRSFKKMSRVNHGSYGNQFKRYKTWRFESAKRTRRPRTVERTTSVHRSSSRNVRRSQWRR